jgi:hypothetical protein
MKTFTAAALLSVLTVASAQETQLPPGMTMHQQQAGLLDREGWTVAQSTEGRYSVKLPCKYNDFTTEDSSPSAAVSRTDTVGCLREDQQKFAVVRMQYRGGAAAAKAYFEQNTHGIGWEAADELKRAKSGKHPALDIVTHRPPRCGFVRIVLLESDIIFLAAESPLPPCEDLKVKADKFFASLSVEGR